MGRTKPTLGYPTRGAAVLAMLGKGWSRAEIAEELNICLPTVSTLAFQARGQESSPRRSDRIPVRTLQIPVGTLNALAPIAATRGMSANGLARLILETVVDARLVDAVLDDERQAEAVG